MSQPKYVPLAPSRPPKTMVELRAWLDMAGSNNLSYQVLSRPIAEGYILSGEAGMFQWSYTERGRVEVVQQFATEAEAVGYAYAAVKADASAWWHLIGLTASDDDVRDLCTALDARGVAWWSDRIPYAGSSHRVFVFGLDGARCMDLRERYGGR